MDEVERKAGFPIRAGMTEMIQNPLCIPSFGFAQDRLFYKGGKEKGGEIVRVVGWLSGLYLTLPSPNGVKSKPMI